ncbi:MAG: Gene Transfer Agent terminase protein [uncultured Sphingomonadaceae bacterium]|uniref:Gene Transfer Agent terminase protein n=1 Tax=uncultured Sphingomonadaceae bacterium TaxID=169976 RepID=A0A6J4TR15_9SPHN|nr:MAG: Gene Transfer Agent terminase protein [uncultured Sphingomonadaceae bacterium]
MSPEHATKAKVSRAEPISTHYARGRVRHAGVFRELEDQLAGMTPGRRYAGPGRSPDRADACVWALWTLLEQRTAEPRISVL